MSSVVLNLASTEQSQVPKSSIAIAFNNLMGRSYSSIEASQEDTFIYSFFKALKKNEPTSKFALKMSQFHPLNQQAILMSAMNFAKENNLNSFAELEKKSKELEEVNKLNLFNEALERKIYPTAIKVLLVSAGVALLGISAYFMNKKAELEVENAVKETRIRIKHMCFVDRIWEKENMLNFKLMVTKDFKIYDRIENDAKLINDTIRTYQDHRSACEKYNTCEKIDDFLSILQKWQAELQELKNES